MIQVVMDRCKPWYMHGWVCVSYYPCSRSMDIRYHLKVLDDTEHPSHSALLREHASVSGDPWPWKKKKKKNR